MLRFLPFLVGAKIPENEPAWQVLVLSSVHTEEAIGFLDSKISEHQHRFQDVFPQEKLTPKHHFLEHYPQLIKAFGPLLSLWTMRFEAKHSFFKRVVRHTHQHGNNPVQPSLYVAKLSVVDVTVLREDIKKALAIKFPGESHVQMANTVCYSGTSYSSGMILARGWTGGLPDFGELIQIAVVKGKPAFILKCLNAWYTERLEGYELENTKSVKVVEPSELSDIFPLAAYTVAGRRMVTLKRYIHLL